MEKNITVGRNLLETITSALYESPIILFREYVQNSLDAYNEAVKVNGKGVLHDFGVTIDIDNDAKRIVIKDNGYGIDSEDDFSAKMLSFGNSTKLDRSQYIGFRGIGRVSALPFCKKLTFYNKSVGSDTQESCEWAGGKYRDLLNDDSTEESTFDETVRSIVSIASEKYEGNTNDHFFMVVIESYSFEIEEVIESSTFRDSLEKLLPLKYSNAFSSSSLIISKYTEFMNEDFEDFMCAVSLNGEDLRKKYSENAHVLESGIVFWELTEKKKGAKINDKIGLMWFTFNRKMTASKSNEYGILVRSKNVLMGDNDTFADLCTNSKEHVGTYSELTATLRGVYGELLINSPKLKDNARREWFKTDDESIYLKYIIVDFMKRLYKYRYAASAYHRISNNKDDEQKKKKLKQALLELVDTETNKVDVSDLMKSESRNEAVEEDSPDTFASKDIPRQSKTKRSAYDELMTIVEEFFIQHKKYDLFLKLRAFIKTHFDKGNN